MGIINRFFSYFTWTLPFKAKIVVVKTSEWKFKANIARDAHLKGNRAKFLGPDLVQ